MKPDKCAQSGQWPPPLPKCLTISRIPMQPVPAPASEMLDNLKYFCGFSTNSCTVFYTMKKGVRRIESPDSLLYRLICVYFTGDQLKAIWL